MKAILALVTGASSGIGLAAAQLLHEAGAEVVGISRTIEPGAVPFACMRCDVGDGAAIRQLVSDLRDGKPAGSPALVNVAGYAAFGPYAEASHEDIERQARVNYIGPALLIREMLPWMLEAGSGHIVNVLSIAGRRALPFAGAYAASKAALLMLGQCVAEEYRARGIRVTNILPGSTDTPLWDDKSFQPNRSEMLSPLAVAECVRDVVLSPPDRSFDEIVLMPPRGIL